MYPPLVQLCGLPWSVRFRAVSVKEEDTSMPYEEEDTYLGAYASALRPSSSVSSDRAPCRKSTCQGGRWWRRNICTQSEAERLKSRELARTHMQREAGRQRQTEMTHALTHVQRDRQTETDRDREREHTCTQSKCFALATNHWSKFSKVSHQSVLTKPLPQN